MYMDKELDIIHYINLMFWIKIIILIKKSMIEKYTIIL